MSSTEGIYQLKPVGRAKLWWSILGAATVLLLLPVVINAAVPDKGHSYEQLTIGTYGYEWEVPVVTADGAPVMCEMTLDDLFMKYWDCNGDTTVVTLMVEGVEDPATSLNRMIRAGLSSPTVGDAPAVASADGRAHALVQAGSEEGAFITLPVVAMSQRGAGDHENLSAIAIVNGLSNDYYASHIWSSMAQERGLPYEQEFPLELEEQGSAGDPFGGLPWDELPWEELPWEDLLQDHGEAPSEMDLLGREMPGWEMLQEVPVVREEEA